MPVWSTVFIVEGEGVLLPSTQPAGGVDGVAVPQAALSKQLKKRLLLLAPEALIVA